MPTKNMTDFDKGPKTVRMTGPEFDTDAKTVGALPSNVPASVEDLIYPDRTLDDMEPVLERINSQEQLTAKWHAEGQRHILEARQYFEEKTQQYLAQYIGLEQTMPDAFKKTYAGHVRAYMGSASNDMPNCVRFARDYVLQKARSNIEHILSPQFQSEPGAPSPKQALMEEYMREVETFFSVKMQNPF